MSVLGIPDQTIPESLKDKQWHVNHNLAHSAFTLSTNYDDQRKYILKMFRGYNAELGPAETKLAQAITCPNGYDLGIEYIVYPLIQSKIEQAIGDFIRRPIKSRAYAMDKSSKNAKFQKKLEMLGEEIMRDIAEQLNPDLGYTPETPLKDLDLPEDVEEFFSQDFKSVAETVANDLIDLFLDVRGEKKKLKGMFRNYLISDRGHAVLDKAKGHTTMYGTHPLDCDYDLDPYKVVQDDHEFFYQSWWLTQNEIYNTFPELDKGQKESINIMFTNMTSLSTSSHDSEQLSSSMKYDGWYKTDNKVNRIRLSKCMWKSQKTVNIKVNENKEGQKFHKKLKEGDRIRKTDTIKKYIGEVPRHCIMLGPEIVLEWGVMEQRLSRKDAPWACTLPVISIVRDNDSGTSQVKSMASKLYQLQELASETLFEIRLALKKVGNSKVLLYDTAQTPKAFTKGGYENGLNRVMHHVKKDQFLMFNSKDKGAKQNFNQFTSLDLSQKGVIQDLFNGLAIIEDLAAKFTGFTPEREGNIGQYQTATGTDKAIRASAARTEVFYTPFDEFVQAILSKAIMKMKFDYEEGEVLQYVVGEFKTKFLKLFKEFFLADMGIYLGDARKDQEMSDIIDRAAEVALGNSSAPEMALGLIEVFEGDSANEKKAVFQRMVNSMAKLREEQAKADAEQAQAAMEAEAKSKEDDRTLTRDGYQKDKDVAYIYKDGKAQDGLQKNQSQERQTAAKLDVDLEKSREQSRQKESVK